MSFIETIPLEAAEGEVREMFERQQGAWGYVPNYAKSFSHRPQVMARWGKLLAELRRRPRTMTLCVRADCRHHN